MFKEIILLVVEFDAKLHKINKYDLGETSF